MENRELQEVIEQFHCIPESYQFSALGDGLIHQTYLAKGNLGSYVLQRINTKIFKTPEKVMANILQANIYLNAPGYKTISFIGSKTGSSLLVTGATGTWRLMEYIPKSQTFLAPSNVAMAFEAGRIIGQFHQLLETAIPGDFYITLPDFHNLSHRWQQLVSSMESAHNKRIAKVEIGRRLAAEIKKFLTDKIPDNLKERVAHNDTKFDNILFDEPTRLALGLIDMDTIMPGYFHSDFGDAARGTCFNVPELSDGQIQSAFLPDFFESMVKGVFSSGLKLTENEINAMPIGVVLMPLLHGIRALTDYLEGDRYYKVTYEEGNLDRASRLLNQAKMALEAIPEMNRIIDQCRSGLT